MEWPQRLRIDCEISSCDLTVKWEFVNVSPHGRQTRNAWTLATDIEKEINAINKLTGNKRFWAFSTFLPIGKPNTDYAI